MQRLLTRAAIVLVVGLAALGLTACNKYGLTGHIDISTDDQFGTTITGWANAADPEFQIGANRWDGWTGGEWPPPAVWTTVVFADGQPVEVAENLWTDRPDVVDAVGPNSWGFETTVRRLPCGNHQICVDIVPSAEAETATVDSTVDCSTLFVPQHEPLAHIDLAQVNGSAVDIHGWFYASPYAVPIDGPPYFGAVIIDGVMSSANFVPGARPDVEAAYSAPGYSVLGLEQAFPLDPGTHEVCLGRGFDVDRATALDCVRVTV